MNDKVEVRIAVAVDTSGNWAAEGGSDLPDRASASLANGGAEPDKVIYWLTATLLVPKPQEVDATVEGSVAHLRATLERLKQINHSFGFTEMDEAMAAVERAAGVPHA